MLELVISSSEIDKKILKIKATHILRAKLFELVNFHYLAIIYHFLHIHSKHKLKENLRN
jgi:hypothetical protein